MCVSRDAIVKQDFIIPFVHDHFAPEGKVNVVLILNEVVSDEQDCPGPCASGVAGF
jgi:hypothetical protein